MDDLAASMGDDIELIRAYTESVERFAALGGADLRARAAEVVTRLGLSADALDHPMGRLSGGQAGRVVLGSILLARFDVLLLDEPTNNLDFDGLALLEDFLSSLRSGVVVVSHDRAFLEKVVDRVMEIEEPSGTASEYTGGFAAYERERQRERDARVESHERYLDERRRLAEKARRTRAWAEAGANRARRRAPDSDKYIRFARTQQAESLASKAKVVERKLERLDPVDKPWESWRLELSFDVAERSGDVVFALEDAVVGRGTFTLGPLSLDVRWGDRIAIVGPNGSVNRLCSPRFLVSSLSSRGDSGGAHASALRPWISPGASFR